MWRSHRSTQVISVWSVDGMYFSGCRGDVTGCEVLKQDNVRLIKNKIQTAVINMIKQRIL